MHVQVFLISGCQNKHPIDVFRPKCYSSHIRQLHSNIPIIVLLPVETLEPKNYHVILPGLTLSHHIRLVKMKYKNEKRHFYSDGVGVYIICSIYQVQQALCNLCLLPSARCQ